MQLTTGKIQVVRMKREWWSRKKTGLRTYILLCNWPDYCVCHTSSKARLSIFLLPNGSYFTSWKDYFAEELPLKWMTRTGSVAHHQDRTSTTHSSRWSANRSDNGNCSHGGSASNKCIGLSAETEPDNLSSSPENTSRIKIGARGRRISRLEPEEVHPKTPTTTALPNDKELSWCDASKRFHGLVRRIQYGCFIPRIILVFIM